MPHKRPLINIARLMAVVVVSAGLATACAPARHFPSQDGAGFSRFQAKEVFTVGFSNVIEKYIEPVLASSFVLEGLKGLGSIDPGLSVERKGKTIVLSLADEVKARYPAPADHDVEGWASLAVELTAAARQSSDELRRASPEKVYEAVFDGSLSILDVFSRYAGSDQARKNRAKREGFGGIGIRFKINKGAVMVTQVMPGTPAEAAGFKTGDRIIRVNNTSMEGLKVSDVIDMLRGQAGSWVSISAARPGAKKPLNFEVKRAHVVATTVIDHSTGSISIFRVSGFNRDTARSLGAMIKKRHKSQGKAMQGVILDMRGNPGGLLKQSVKVADLFLSQGRIIATQGRHANSDQHYEAGGRDIIHGMPMVVLLDGKSASAAEIVAAALQDRGRVVVIGTSSFGKGTVQTVIRLPNDGEITLTWSRILAPSGYALHGLGVRPSICTSGSTDSGLELIATALAEKAKASAALAVWRAPGLKEEGRRLDLRVACPAERRRTDADIKVARQLLGDRGLYARVLDLTSTSLAENTNEKSASAP